MFFVWLTLCREASPRRSTHIPVPHPAGAEPLELPSGTFAPPQTSWVSSQRPGTQGPHARGDSPTVGVSPAGTSHWGFRTALRQQSSENNYRFSVYTHFCFHLSSAYFAGGIIRYSSPGCCFSIWISFLAISSFSTLFQGKQQQPLQTAASRLRLKAGQLPPHTRAAEGSGCPHTGRCWLYWLWRCRLFPKPW